MNDPEEHLFKERDQKIKREVLKDPLGEMTHKYKKILLLISVLGILLVSYKLKFNNINILGFQILLKYSHFIQGILSVLEFYFFIGFLFYAIRDWGHWKTTTELTNLKSYWSLVRRASENHHNLNYQLSKITSNPEEQKKFPDYPIDIKKINNIVEETLKSLKWLNKKVNSLHSKNRIFKMYQYSGIITYELILPLTISVFAIIKLYPYLFPFLKIILKG